MIKWRESLPLRVATTTVGLLTLVLMVVTFATYLNTALLVQQGLDQALAATVPITADSLREVQDYVFRPGEWRRPPRHYRVFDAWGNVRVGEAPFPVNTAALNQALVMGRAFTNLTPSGGRLRIRSEPTWWQAMTPGNRDLRVMYAAWGPPGDRMVLELATPLEQAATVLPALLSRMLLLTILGAALCGLVAWRMANQFYRPLHAVIATADQITTETLAKRIPDEWGDRTLQHLCHVLNAMIARLQEAFETQGRFVTNAAHELRGSLGAMRAQLEVHLRRERTPAEYQEALAITLEETKRLSILAEHLLILARYERGAGLVLQQRIQLAPLLQRAADEVCRATDAEVSVTAPTPLVLDGDPVALERAVANLIQNGVQAGGPRSQWTPGF